MDIFRDRAFTDGGSSFVDVLAAMGQLPAFKGSADSVPHGTTIVACKYRDGVLMAGDRRATTGGWIASRDIQKVFPADGSSLIGAAGVAGLSQELVKVLQVELEHYEKINGVRLSLTGRANRLAAIVRASMALAFEDLPVIPIYCGYEEGAGHIFSFDVVGGRYEETDFAAVGSGAVFARGSLKKSHDPTAELVPALTSVIDALTDAADEDSGTSGPDTGRDIWPVVYTTTAAGVARVDDELLRQIYADVAAKRSARWAR